jgi:hypothetical protein
VGPNPDESIIERMEAMRTGTVLDRCLARLKQNLKSSSSSGSPARNRAEYINSRP